MNIRILIAAGVSALALGLTATSASAATDTVRRVSPPSSNPHDVFRTVVRVPAAPGASARLAKESCCEAMMSGRSGGSSECEPGMARRKDDSKG